MSKQRMPLVPVTSCLGVVVWVNPRHIVSAGLAPSGTAYRIKLTDATFIEVTLRELERLLVLLDAPRRECVVCGAGLPYTGASSTCSARCYQDLEGDEMPEAGEGEAQ